MFYVPPLPTHTIYAEGPLSQAWCRENKDGGGGGGGAGLCCYGKGKVLSTLGTGVSLETPLCAVPVGERTKRLAFYEDSM